ncbi:MAG TPA: hypothetical protein VHD90_03305 [Phototrophicaceae bacterium]|nr:hypothetical protein [Phototrophicaceae bacterium]
MLQASQVADQFEQARELLSTYQAELARHGIETNPSLELARATQLYPYYDQRQQRIYLNLIDPANPLWRLRALGIMAFWGFRDDEADLFLDYWRLQLRYTIAHELGHHLRDHCGRMDGGNLWNEEQIANRFASALTRDQFTPTEVERFCGYLRHHFEGLAPKIDGHALSIYGHLHYPLRRLGLIDDATFAAVLSDETHGDPADVLKVMPGLAPEVAELVALRDPLIARFNAAYAANPVEYTYYHSAWVYYELSSAERFDLDSLAHAYLH